MSLRVGRRYTGTSIQFKALINVLLDNKNATAAVAMPRDDIRVTMPAHPFL